MAASQAIELVHETQMEGMRADNRGLRQQLNNERATKPNNPLARVLTANAAAAMTTLADSQIGDGKGDGVKLGLILGGTAAAAAAFKMGHYTVYNIASDAVIGASCAQTTLATRDYGLKVHVEREKRRLAQQNAAAPAAAPAAAAQTTQAPPK